MQTACTSAEADMAKKCKCKSSVTIKPDGIHTLDPCRFEVTERYANVTIEVLRCRNCGAVEISWFRQEDTVDLMEEEKDA